MPRPRQDNPHRPAWTKRLQKAREDADYTLDMAAVDARRLLGYDKGPSRERVRAYEQGMVSDDGIDVMLMTALCNLYGVELVDIAPHFAARFNKAMQMAGLQRREMSKRARRRASLELALVSSDTDDPDDDLDPNPEGSDAIIGRYERAVTGRRGREALVIDLRDEPAKVLMEALDAA